MSLRDIILPELTICNVILTNKKQALEKIARLLNDADHRIKYQDILKVLQQRERLGSTAIGHGVAIPHSRAANLKKAVCVVMSLNNAINFEAEDTVAVDLIFGLLVPEKADEEHLKILSTLAYKLRNKAFRTKLREARTDEALFRAMVEDDS